ncbi:hypothetical protein CSHISOI_04864 [Colletotrichum shisoi]|uniref:Uncharacterized protein n=1 Tax=Colletotrichum shisoi TaxID=2078593 RepID=A0A5Q4BU65_9PEZI|nr:hypothetical protein CSHISOI_04864 [Colletotrichum shisoi]
MNTLKHGSSRDNPADSPLFSEQTLTRNKARADRSSVYPNQTQEERSLRRRSLSHPSESFAPMTIPSLRVPLVLLQTLGRISQTRENDLAPLVTLPVFLPYAHTLTQRANRPDETS